MINVIYFEWKFVWDIHMYIILHFEIVLYFYLFIVPVCSWTEGHRGPLEDIWAVIVERQGKLWTSHLFYADKHFILSFPMF